MALKFMPYNIRLNFIEIKQINTCREKKAVIKLAKVNDTAIKIGRLPQSKVSKYEDMTRAAVKMKKIA